MSLHLEKIRHLVRSLRGSGQKSSTPQVGMGSVLSRRPGQVLEVFVFCGGELIEQHVYDPAAHQICKAEPQRLWQATTAIKDFMQDASRAVGNTLSFHLKSGLHVSAASQGCYTVIAVAHGSFDAATTERWLLELVDKASHIA